jgi:hypothetical protein
MFCEDAYLQKTRICIDTTSMHSRSARFWKPKPLDSDENPTLHVTDTAGDITFSIEMMAYSLQVH